MSTMITKLAKELKLPKVDAKEPLKLEVKPIDIERADLKNPQACAFSRACKRTHPVKKAFFFRSTAWLQYPDKLVRYLLPPSMQKEIVAFDRNRTMEPGLYQLTAPAKSQTMKAIHKRSKKRPGRHQPGNTKIKRKVVHKTQGIRGLSVPA